MQPFFSSTRASIMFWPTMKWRCRSGFRSSSSTDLQGMSWNWGLALAAGLRLVLALGMGSPGCASSYSTERILPNHRGAVPGGGSALNSFDSLLQVRSGRSEREADKVPTGGAECSAWDSGDTGFFKHDAAEFFSGHSGVGDIDPGIKRAFGRLAAESGDAVEIANELLAALRELVDHARCGTVAIAQSFDGGVLAELSDAGIAVDSQHREGGNDM